MYRKCSIIGASAKYRLRRPSTANTFELNTRNGWLVTAKIAGIESTANMTSEVSTNISTTKSRVA